MFYASRAHATSVSHGRAGKGWASRELRACLIQKLQKVVRREFDLFVSVFGGAVMDGDQSR
jgi:hypothetical protein